nr:2Fe-2S iron-sulfur cluster-binding protein [Nocardia sp. XZ_19_369]
MRPAVGAALLRCDECGGYEYGGAPDCRRCRLLVDDIIEEQWRHFFDQWQGEDEHDVARLIVAEPDRHDWRIVDAALDRIVCDEWLLWVLRDILGVRGPKYGCGIEVCHACTCLLDSDTRLTCQLPMDQVAGRTVTTIEGLADGDTLHPVQQAWIDLDVAQCGYCQPGQIMNAVAMLKRIPDPTDDDIDSIENVCRCGTYYRIRQAIKHAAQMRTD